MPYTTLEMKERQESQFNVRDFYTGTASDIISTGIDYLPLPAGQRTTIDFLWSALSGTQQFRVTIENNGVDYQALIPPIGQTVADIALNVVLVKALVAIGVVAGVTAGTPLIIAAIVGSNILMEANFTGIRKLWQEAVTEVMQRYDANGTARYPRFDTRKCRRIA